MHLIIKCEYEDMKLKAYTLSDIVHNVQWNLKNMENFPLSSSNEQLSTCLAMHGTQCLNWLHFENGVVLQAFSARKHSKEFSF